MFRFLVPALFAPTLAETRDLAEGNRERVGEIAGRWEAWAKRTNVYPLPKK